MINIPYTVHAPVSDRRSRTPCEKYRWNWWISQITIELLMRFLVKLQKNLRISPPRFLAECCKRQLNQVSLVLLYFRLSAFSDLCWVCLSVFSCTVLFVSISQVIGCEDRLRNDLYCVGWGVKLYSNQTLIGLLSFFRKPRYFKPNPTALSCSSKYHSLRWQLMREQSSSSVCVMLTCRVSGPRLGHRCIALSRQ